MGLTRVKPFLRLCWESDASFKLQLLCASVQNFFTMHFLLKQSRPFWSLKAWGAGKINTGYCWLVLLLFSLHVFHVSIPVLKSLLQSTHCPSLQPLLLPLWPFPLFSRHSDFFEFLSLAMPCVSFRSFCTSCRICKNCQPMPTLSFLLSPVQRGYSFRIQL